MSFFIGARATREKSQEVMEALGNVHVVGIELRRLAGRNTTGHDVLAALEETIAELFLQNDDVIICYYCEFSNSSNCFSNHKENSYAIRAHEKSSTRIK